MKLFNRKERTTLNSKNTFIDIWTQNSDEGILFLFKDEVNDNGGMEEFVLFIL